MSFNSNTWYSIQNFGNDWFLACQSVGSCVTADDDLSNAELYQLATVNGTSSYYIRPKALNADASGNAYCVNVNTGVPAISPCSSSSAIWGIQNWNGQTAGDGEFFYSFATGDSLRLSLSNNQTYSLAPYNDNTLETQRVLMQWGVASRGAINDQSYSTVPAAITSGSSTSSAPSNSTATSSIASSSNSTSSTGSVTSNSVSSASSSVGPSASTRTMIITPIITASQATSTGAPRTSSTVTPTLASGAYKARTDLRAALALMVVFPQILRWLL